MFVGWLLTLPFFVASHFRREAYCKEIGKRLRAKGVTYTVPIAGRSYEYPRLMIRLSEEHLSDDAECVMLARRLSGNLWWTIVSMMGFVLLIGLLGMLLDTPR